MNPTVTTASGQYVDLLNPNPDQLHIGDIAHALANICRFTGHTRRFYSVAEHCVRMSYIVPPELAYAALMHDAPEAYLGDVSSPLKALLPDYQRIYANFERVLFGRFNVPPICADVKHADLRMLAWERALYVNHGDTPWPSLAGIVVVEFSDGLFKARYPLGWAVAFLARFNELAPQKLIHLS